MRRRTAELFHEHGVCVRHLQMKVRLTRKYAERIDGIDLSGRTVGQTMDLPPREAWLLIAEQWGAPERRERSEATPHRRRADDWTSSASLHRD